MIKSYCKTLSFVAIVVINSCLLADLKVTKISKNNNNEFTVVLNNDVAISNIVLLNNNELKLPKYHGKVKVYKQFSILKRNFMQYLIDAVSNNKTSTKIKNTSFKINKISIYRGKYGTIKAFASVIFDDDIEVECRVMQGYNGLWIAWPCDKVDNSWVKNLKFINKDLKKQVEQELIARYISVADENAKMEIKR